MIGLLRRARAVGAKGCVALRIHIVRFANRFSSYWYSCPSGMPTAYWRWIGWFRVTIAIGSVVAVAIVCHWFLAGRRHIVPHLFYGGFALYYLGVKHVLRRRFHRRVAALGYLVCTECGYDLRGLSDLCQCPECGVVLGTASEIRKKWRTWFRVT